MIYLNLVSNAESPAGVSFSSTACNRLQAALVIPIVKQQSALTQANRTIFSFLEQGALNLSSGLMIGTILNVAGILIGSTAGLARLRPLSRASESYFKVLLAALTVFYGLRLTLLTFSGSFRQVLTQLLILVLALMLGKLAGRLLHLQAFSNAIGQRARERMTERRGNFQAPAHEGFETCAALFCAAPLGMLGAVQDGLCQYFYPLAIKAAMDGLAAQGFVLIFGWSVLLSAIPVMAFQGTISLVSARILEPFLSAHGLLPSVNAVGGLLVFCVALIMLGLKRIALTDYLPSLVVAPLLTWLLR